MNKEEIKKQLFDNKNFKYVSLLDRIKLLFTKMQYTFDYDNHGYYTCIGYKVRNGKIYVFDNYEVKNGSFTISDGRITK